MFKRSHIYLLILAICSFLLFVNSCASRGLNPPSTLVPTLGDKVTPTASRTPKIILSDTPTPSSTSATTTPHPLFTLSPEQAEEKIQELMKTNGNCLLPCWWGITPGVTQFSEATLQLDAFLSLLASDFPTNNEYGGIHYSYPDMGPFDGAFGTLYMLSKGNIVVSIVLDGYDTIAQYYGIQSMLKNYGPPDNILIYTLKDSYGEGGLPFVITLDYSSRGILVYYKGNGLPIYETESIQLCYNRTLIPPKLILWDPAFENPIGDQGLDYVYTIWPKMKSLENATDIGNEDFYRRFTESNLGQSICLNTPASLWDY